MERFKEGFQRLFDRGPDDQRIEKGEYGIAGFARLAIMGLTEEGMQPFRRDDAILLCNGEIYGFRKMKEFLSEKYSFVSGSDCEILLPLFKEMGCEMFSLLDAEYALAMYVPAEGWIAARDPIGIRPLFYGYTPSGKICFGSTAASLLPFADRVMPFPPGCYYRKGEFVRYTDIARPMPLKDEPLDETCGTIHDLLIDGVVKRMDSDAAAGYLLSGGLDSSLVCAIAQQHSTRPIRTFSIGMDTDAIDCRYAREVADYIGSDHTEFRMTRDDVIAALPEVIRILESWDITTIRASIGMYILCRKIHETTDIKVLFTGEISDELFGYKYTDFAPDAESFEKEAEKRVRELYMYDVLRADRCISSNSLEGRVPFGDLSFVRYVMGIDPSRKMNTYHMGKYLLRHAFEKDKLLPHDILFRDKAAFSDAVGHSLADDLKEYAESRYSDSEFEEKSASYQWCRPFTKEALLYREIFEKFYPGREAWIKDYWMPNRSWKGCDVNDPSARYLSNYGASGR